MSELPEKEVFPWAKIQKTFDKLCKEGDVDEIFSFLRQVIDDTHVCSSADCEIFPELHRLDLRRMNFNETKPDVMQWPDAIKKSQWLQEYQDYVVESKRIFSKTFALKTSKDTRGFEV